jgi:hypothetical protein
MEKANADPVTVTEMDSQPPSPPIESDRGASQAITMIPWDPDCTEHVERLRLQRIACGWKADQVDNWRELQKSGKIGMHWIVSKISCLSCQSRLGAHDHHIKNSYAPLEHHWS